MHEVYFHWGRKGSGSIQHRVKRETKKEPGGEEKGLGISFNGPCSRFSKRRDGASPEINVSLGEERGGGKVGTEVEPCAKASAR